MSFVKYQKYSTTIIRLGLGLVFLANSYTAFASPDDFSKLVSESFLASLFPISLDTFIKFIGISDGLVAALLIIGKGGKIVAGYATLWIVGVMAVIGIKDLGSLLEHFGFLSLALYLLINCDKID